jgi:hypothetical protein
MMGVSSFSIIASAILRSVQNRDRQFNRDANHELVFAVWNSGTPQSSGEPLLWATGIEVNLKVNTKRNCDKCIGIERINRRSLSLGGFVTDSSVQFTNLFRSGIETGSASASPRIRQPYVPRERQNQHRIVQILHLGSMAVCSPVISQRPAMTSSPSLRVHSFLGFPGLPAVRDEARRDCRRCAAVVVEELPRWARRPSWKETAEWHGLCEVCDECSTI